MDNDLESFRRQWREEVARRAHPVHPVQPARPAQTRSWRQGSAEGPGHGAGTGTGDSWIPPTHHEASDRTEEETEPVPQDQTEIVQQVGQLSLGTESGNPDEDGFQPATQKEPSSALEHFETAVQKEAEGSLGDSLQHYRKAYRVRQMNPLGEY